MIDVGSTRMLAVAALCACMGSGAWTTSALADHDPCPHPVAWVPADLGRIVEAHHAWMNKLGYVKPDANEPEPTAEPDPAVLCRADLRDVDLSEAYLVEADFREADLSGATLSGANLIAADLSGAKLVGANLDGANLFLANLKDADLTGASLREAHLVKTDLEGARLEGADLTGATD